MPTTRIHTGPNCPECNSNLINRKPDGRCYCYNCGGEFRSRPGEDVRRRPGKGEVRGFF
jgi:ribosomal protein L37AE/L43A